MATLACGREVGVVRHMTCALNQAALCCEEFKALASALKGAGVS